MEIAQKITILVAVQIALIVSSFFTLAYFESQTVLAGNMVNIAGKNRVLASTVILEIVDVDPNNGAEHGRVLTALENLEQNVYLLKNGGDLNGIEIPPLPPRFDQEWKIVAEKFDAYRDTAMAALAESEATRQDVVREMSRSGNELIAVSDVLTTSLGHDTEKISRDLVLMQVTLGIINVATHLFMIGLIWNIFKRYAERLAEVERLATVGKFAAMLAHDIRNPLGIIRNSSELLRMHEGLPESASKELSRMNRAIGRMSHQIEDVLGYVHAVPLVLEPNSVLSMLRRSVGELEIPPNVALEMPGDDCDLVVECDSAKVEIVFINLLTNAVQAVGNRTGRIMVRAKGDRSHAIVEVENSDAHIPEEDLPRIFDPLFTTKMQGTGLGLTSCKNIVDLHGGTISARSGENHVTFTIRLPKQQDDGDQGCEKEDSRDR